MMKRIAISLAALMALGAGGVGAYRRLTASSKVSGPTAQVRKGEFPVVIRCRGELKARRTLQIAAPLNVPELRIVWLAASGAMVKEGDPIIRFDPSSLKQQLREKEAALKQAEAALSQAKAESGIAADQDQRDLKESRYQVERAQLEVSKQEIVSRLQGEESRIDLKVAEGKMSVQDAKTGLNEASNAAKVATLDRQRQKALDEVELTNARIQKMEMRAPITGMVLYLPNFAQGWMNAKPFKVGDQVWPGAVIAELPDLKTLEMEAKVEEIDRGRVATGQRARVRLDALPEKPFDGKLAQLSPLTEVGWEWPPTRSFRGWSTIDNPDDRLRPGMNGRLDVTVSRIADALSLPAKALFTRNGKPVVYLVDGGRVAAREVEILARNPDEVAIKGVPEKAEVLLVEPAPVGKEGS